jgi:hypothetical protein
VYGSRKKIVICEIKKKENFLSERKRNKNKK